MTRILTHSRHASPIGPLHLVTEGAVLVALDYEGYEARMMRLLKRHAPAVALQAGPTPTSIAASLDAYFAGDMTALDAIRVGPAGTDFQLRVWKALREIPAGETRSYGALAATLGMPKGSRAVGLANGSNPVGIAVPCHRVIGANGTLTGYAGGLERKEFLLSHEGARTQRAA